MARSRFVRSMQVLGAAVLGAALTLTALPASGTAQVIRSRTTGPMVGAHISGASMSLEDADRSAGAGLGASLGWGFASGLGVYAQIDRSNVDVRNQPAAPGTWGIWHVDAGVRYHFARPDRTLVPFVQAAFTLRDVEVTDVGDIGGVTVDQIDLRGYGASVGGGVQLHITPAVAFRFAGIIGFGSLTDAEVDGVTADGFDISMTSARLNIGLAVWPLG